MEYNIFIQTLYKYSLERTTLLSRFAQTDLVRLKNTSLRDRRPATLSGEHGQGYPKWFFFFHIYAYSPFGSERHFKNRWHQSHSHCTTEPFSRTIGDISVGLSPSHAFGAQYVHLKNFLRPLITVTTQVNPRRQGRPPGRSSSVRLLLIINRE